MTQAVIPQFRARKSGVVINVTSSVTFAPMPLVSVYTASKTAIEGFTGSLAHELQAFNVRVKLVEPGYGPTTRFTQNSETRIEDVIPAPYMAFATPVLAAFAKPGAVTTERDVAETVYLKKMLDEKFEAFSFSPAGASVYQLGNFGTARTRLKNWELRPEAGSRALQ